MAVRINIDLADRASGPLDRLQRKFQALGTSKGFANVVQGVGIGAGIAVWGALTSAITGAFESAIQGAIAEEAGIKRLDAALRANVTSWDGNAAAIERAIKPRMDLGFADDELRDSLAKLVVGTRDVNKALELQQTAMDLARFKGVSLADASLALAKMWAGSTRELKGLGLELELGADKFDNLRRVQGAVAGQGAAYASTVEGKMLRAQVKFNEAIETLAVKLLPLLAAAADLASDAVDQITEHGSNLVNLIGSALIPGFTMTVRLLEEQAAAQQAATDKMKATAALLQHDYTPALVETNKALASGFTYLDHYTQGTVLLATVGKASASAVGEAMGRMASKASRAARDAGAAWETFGYRVGRSTDQITADLADFEQFLKGALDPLPRYLKLQGQLSSKALVAGLASGDEERRTKAQEIAKDIIAQLRALRTQAYNAGVSAGKNFGLGFFRGVNPFLKKLPGLDVGDTGTGARRQQGGPAARGMLVGENGPEWISGANVYPNSGWGGAGMVLRPTIVLQVGRDVLASVTADLGADVWTRNSSTLRGY